jgi:hypothetical protein
MRNITRHSYDFDAADGQVHLKIPSATFQVGAYDTNIVASDQRMAILDVHQLQDHDGKFHSHTLSPPDVTRLAFPTIAKAPGIPARANANANAP